jgi:cold shock CspA family protein/ribosome-associated translation inhibitor RaiA
MNVPVEITYRNIEKTDFLDDLIHRQAAKLEQTCGHISSCRVALERPQVHQRTGNIHRLRIDVTVPPGHELVSTQEPGDNDMHDNVETVILRGFKAVRRQLTQLVDRQRGQVKAHEEARALVIRLFADYGFLKTPEGREIYFHRHAVLHGDFERLAIGTAVRFDEEPGLDGPQASTVQIIDKPGVAAGQQEPADLATPPRGWDA